MLSIANEICNSLGMPKIVQYLSHLSNARHYDDQELNDLQTVYDRARQVLGIDISDPRREKLAVLIFACSDQTRDVEPLLSRVIERFRSQEG